MSRFQKFNIVICASCKIPGKQIVIRVRKLSFCADCPAPTISEYNEFMYKHNSNTTLLWVQDKLEKDKGLITRGAYNKRQEEV